MFIAGKFSFIFLSIFKTAVADFKFHYTATEPYHLYTVLFSSTRLIPDRE